MPRRKHTEGFTLSELLLAIAIILVLAAIAIPSLVNVQINLRMAELNNAAQQIANAAQTQMTAKKTAGTWYATITGENNEIVFNKAKNPPADSDASDTYYMTASEARDAGIIPTLSIDEAVRLSDYVIEFEASTASVVSVFYSDGKQGFFDTSHTDRTDAQVYYEAGESRDQAVRIKARPMIGYYEGTPAGATPEVALANPVIYVDDQGQLCVQNPNLGGQDGSLGSGQSTALSVAVSKMNSDVSAACMISGLDGSSQTMVTISFTDGSNQYSYSNTGDAKIVTRTARDGSTVNDVFAIDLNALARMVSTSAARDGASQGEKDLAAAVAQFVVGDDIRVDARVTMAGPSVPSTATAYMKWPQKPAKIALYVTDPAPDADKDGKVSTDHIDGTYTAPQASLELNSGEKPVVDLWHDESKSFAIDTTSEALAGENGESARQAYTGGWISLADALENSDIAQVRADVGSYRPESEDSQSHSYQVNEIWVNGTRVGYRMGYDQATGSSNEWKWENATWEGSGSGSNPFVDSEGNVLTDITTGTLSIFLDANNLTNSGISTNDDGGYDIYIRTAPRTDEVQAFVTREKATISAELGSSSDASSRGAGDADTALRELFENEFGASSAVASWHATTQEGTTEATRTSEGAYPSTGELRVYYSGTPAVAWAGDNPTYSGDSPYTALANAVLWLYKGDGLDPQPAAFVRDARAGATNYSLESAASSTSDFRMPVNRDELFYRVIEYCGSDGVALSAYDLQYVPYTVQSGDAYATVENGPAGSGGTSFSGWTYVANSGVSVTAGSLVGSYDVDLAFGYVQLRARYQSADSVGLMYLEFDSSGNPTGYYGALDGASTSGFLPDDNAIASWGYYIVVPAGAQAPWYQRGGDKNNQYNWASCSLVRRSVTLMGSLYDLYVAPTTWSGSSRGIPFKAGSSPVNAWNVDINATPTYEYSYSSDFAAAVAAGSASTTVAANWGSQSSPWIVRHADQFIGCLEMNNIQKYYLNDAFLQTHDIDLRNSSVQWQNGYKFAGAYDGGNYSISGYKLSKDDNGHAGLFTVTSGAVLRKINLADVMPVNTMSISGGAGAQVGLLVGSAQDTTIEGCTVSGQTSSEGTLLSINLSLPEWTSSGNHVGGIVGYISSSNGSSSIKNCRVNNVSFVLTSDYKDINHGMAIGGLAGYAKGTKINEDEEEYQAVSNVNIDIKINAQNQPTISDPSSMGGLVGKLDWSNDSLYIPKLSSGAISNVGLTSKVLGSSTALFTGAIIGKTTSPIPVGSFSANMISNVTHNDSALTKLVGNG